MIYLIYGFIVLVRMVTVMSWLQARMRHVACCEKCHVVHDIVLAVAASGYGERKYPQRKTFVKPVHEPLAQRAKNQ